MPNARQVFHWLSYLQYPMIAASFIFYVPFIMSMTSGEPDLELLDKFLIMLGVSLSFSTMQDTTKTQNKLSKRVWESPRAGKLFLSVLGVFTLFLIVMGLVLLLFPVTSVFGEIAVGILLLGLGLLGLMQSAIEMYENHRLDKNPKSE